MERTPKKKKPNKQKGTEETLPHIGRRKQGGSRLEKPENLRGGPSSHHRSRKQSRERDEIK